MRFLLCSTLLLILFGCSRGERICSSLEVPSDWKASSVEEIEERELFPLCWWEIFDDPTLNALEEEALLFNLDLHSALGRIKEAQGALKIAGAPLYPHLNFQFSNSNEESLFKNPFAPSTSFRFRQFQANFLFNLTYEADIWGKAAAGKHAAQLDVIASYCNYNAIVLTLTSLVATSYFELHAWDSQIELLEGLKNLYENLLTLTKKRYEEGLVAYADISNLILEKETIVSQLLDANRQRALTENVLAILTGKAASLFSVDAKPLTSFTPSIALVWPCTVLSRRPDVALALAQMQASHERVYEAQAAYLPTFMLSGSLGYLNPIHLADLFDWQSRLWEYAYTIAQTLFDGGTIKGNIEVARGVYLQRVSAYEQSVLTAIKDVEDALVEIIEREGQYRAFTEAAEAAEELVRLSEASYQEGTISYLDRLSAQNTLLNAQRNQIEAQRLRLKATIALIKAIGG